MRIHHLALRTCRLEALTEFYSGVLGLRVLKRDDRSVWLAAGETVVMLERAGDDEPPVPPGSLELVAFAVSEAAKATLASKGVTIEAQTEFTLYLRDPDGRRVGLSSYDFSRGR
jgi:glyoxylase I family protein